MATASQQKDKTYTNAAFSGVWVKGSTLMTPIVVTQEAEDEPMDLALYRMPHVAINPDDPARDFEHTDKW